MASARASLQGSAQMENPMKASTARLRMMLAIAATSTGESRIGAMRHPWRQFSSGIDLDQAASATLGR
jgi:hypothetical protein